MSATPASSGLAALPEILRGLGSRRVLVVTGPSRRFVDRVESMLQDFELTIFARARRHVPVAVLEAAARELEGSRADTVVALGGGSAIGLGKALRLGHDVRFVAIPTTYAGSEHTSLYGITESAGKKTGRDARVKPDAVVHDIELTLGMPRVLTVQSLMNSFAHALGALSNPALGPEARELAFSAIELLYPALETLASDPENRAAREAAFRGAAFSARALEAGTAGAHHKLAHALGGRFDLDHGGLHSVLLPHTLHELRDTNPDLVRDVERRLAVSDLEARLFDCLARAGASVSLMELGATRPELEAFVAETAVTSPRLASHAYHGRRPSVAVRLVDFGLSELAAVHGPPLEKARVVLVALHGRMASAESILSDALGIAEGAPDVAIVAPQATGGSWYQGRYYEARQKLGAELEHAVAAVSAVLSDVEKRVARERVVLMGFSQGACLAVEVFSRRSEPLGALFCFSGAAIGAAGEERAPGEAARGVPVLVGASDGDPWLRKGDIERTAALLERAGSDVHVINVPGNTHAVHEPQRVAAHAVIAAIR